MSFLCKRFSVFNCEYTNTSKLSSICKKLTETLMTDCLSLYSLVYKNGMQLRAVNRQHTLKRQIIFPTVTVMMIFFCKNKHTAKLYITYATVTMRNNDGVVYRLLALDYNHKM